MNDPADREVLVFNQALLFPAHERDGYLSETCRDDAALRGLVATLLEAQAQAGVAATDVAQTEAQSGHRSVPLISGAM